MMRGRLRTLTVVAVCSAFFGSSPVFASEDARETAQPNIILILADDVGYGDLGCYGWEKVVTPNIDRLAEDGMRLTDFHVPANVCSPSRAAILTGRHPMRCGYPVARANFPKYEHYGLAPEELTVAEMLNEVNYRNLFVGKWHLGFHVDGSHPLDAGFDEHLGIPSNYASKALSFNTLYRGKAVEREQVRLEDLTTLYTDEVVRFIERDSDAPFFIMVSHHIAHLPIKPSEDFEGATKNGAYADFMLELDHSTGRIMQALADNDKEENTLVVFTSDNGPAKGGSAGELNGGKYVTMEGGHRVPCIFKWPGKIEEGAVNDTTVTSMDLFPLFLGLVGASVPSDRTIDGVDIADLLLGNSDESPHKAIYYYNGTNLQAVRMGKWKLHLPRTVDDQPFWAKQTGGNPKKVYLSLDEYMLFDLDRDVGERRNVAAQHPEIVETLKEAADRIRHELGDVDVVGSDQRDHGLTHPQEREGLPTSRQE